MTVAVIMSLAEAQRCVSDIKQGIANVRSRIWELYTREGWRALGYPTWQACKEQEFGISSRHIERLLSAERVERSIFDGSTTKWSQIPESHLRPLTGLDPDQQREAWSKVTQENPDEITGAKVQEVVDRDYRDYERDVLLPQLHDAGLDDAPQILSGQHDHFPPVPEERQEEVEKSLRKSIEEVLILCREGHTIGECTDELLEIMGQSSNSITLAAHFVFALVQGPQTQADLTVMAIRVCGGTKRGMEREDWLRWRKKALRLMDSLTYGGCGIYEHKLQNGQTLFALDEKLEE